VRRVQYTRLESETKERRSAATFFFNNKKKDFFPIFQPERKKRKEK